MYMRALILTALIIGSLYIQPALGGASSPAITTTHDATLSSSSSSYSCSITYEYGYCLVRAMGTPGTDLIIQTTAGSAASTGYVLYSKLDNGFGWEQQVMFDRSTKASAQDSSGSTDMLMRAVTIPGNVVLSQYYYFLIQTKETATFPRVYTVQLGPNPTTPSPTTATETGDDLGLQTITLDQTVTFTNTPMSYSQETWRYFKVDTSSVAAPKSIVVTLSATQLDNSYSSSYSGFEGPSLFISSQYPAMLEVDTIKTAGQMGTYAYPSSTWSQTGGTAHTTFAWHQPKGETWSDMYVTVAANANTQAWSGGRRLMGGDLSAIEGSSTATTYTISVSASTVTSCPTPSGSAAQIVEASTGYGDAGYTFTVDYPVDPALTANSNQLLSTTLNAANFEIDEGVATSVLSEGCNGDGDRSSWLAVNVPTCTTDFYAMPQCKSDCQQMAAGCISFLTILCDNHPTTNCQNYYALNGGNDASSWDDYLAGVNTAAKTLGTMIIVIIVVVILGVICGIIGCWYCCCRKKDEQQAVVVQMAPGAAPSGVQPADAVYMKNGVWLDKNDNPCQQA